MAEELGGKYTKTGSQERLKEEGTLQSQGEKSAVDEVTTYIGRLLHWLSSASLYSLNHLTRSTQPGIPPGSLNRVPASAGVRAGISPLSGGR